ncbi:MAG: hypothetical protein ACYDAY_10000 [Candidatus Dormibacteria bacterium]
MWAAPLVMAFGAFAGATTAVLLDRGFSFVAGQIPPQNRSGAAFTGAWVVGLGLSLTAAVAAAWIAYGRRPPWATVPVALALLLVPIPGGQLFDRWIIHSASGPAEPGCSPALTMVGGVPLLTSGLSSGANYTVAYAGRPVDSPCGPAHAPLSPPQGPG